MRECGCLVIGGGVAAYNAAKRIRRLAPDTTVLLVSEDELPPYDLPPLSKEFLRGEKTEQDIVYPSLAAGEGSVELLLSTRVLTLNPAARTAHLSDGESVRFDKALLATGASSVRLRVPGADLPGIFHLRTAKEARAIAAAAKGARTALVVGAGFIGLEVAASLSAMGLEVTVVEALDRIWPRFADPGVADIVRQRCAEAGIRFVTGQRIIGLEGEGRVTAAITSTGDRLACDLVCVGIGIRPNIELATAAGLLVDDGVVVDGQMRTSAAHIYAAGDAISYPDPILGARLRSEHWGHAEYSGQLAGANMTGGTAQYDFMAYAWSDIFDLHIESAGCVDNHDEIVVRGDPQSRRFTSLYLREGALVGYCAVNEEPVEFASYRRLIRSGQRISQEKAKLSDPEINVRSLIAVAG